MSEDVALFSAIARCGPADAARLLACATKLGIDPLDFACIRLGHSETEVCERAARWAGLAFSAIVPSIARFPGLPTRVSELSEVRSLRLELLDREIMFVAPRFRHFAALAAQGRTNPDTRRRICVVPPRELRRALAERSRARLIDYARQNLSRTWPFATAHLDLGIVIRAGFVVTLFDPARPRRRGTVLGTPGAGATAVRAAGAARLVPHRRHCRGNQSAARRPQGLALRCRIASLFRAHPVARRGAYGAPAGAGDASTRLSGRKARHQIHRRGGEPAHYRGGGAGDCRHPVRTRHRSACTAGHQTQGARFHPAAGAGRIHRHLRRRGQAGARSTAPHRHAFFKGPGYRLHPGRTGAGKRRGKRADGAVRFRIWRPVRHHAAGSGAMGLPDAARRHVQPFSHRHSPARRRLGCLQRHRGRRSRSKDGAAQAPLGDDHGAHL